MEDRPVVDHGDFPAADLTRVLLVSESTAALHPVKGEP